MIRALLMFLLDGVLYVAGAALWCSCRAWSLLTSRKPYARTFAVFVAGQLVYATTLLALGFNPIPMPGLPGVPYLLKQLWRMLEPYVCP